MRRKWQIPRCAMLEYAKTSHSWTNEAVGHLRKPIRRLAQVICIICPKVEQFEWNAHQSAKRTRKRPQKQAKFHKFESMICNCGWNDIHTAPFAAPGFLCQHAVGRSMFELPKSTLIDTATDRATQRRILHAR
jgi:hypothetical protein